MLRSLAFVAALLPLAVHAQDEEEGRSVLLLYKKMEPMEGFAIGEPINVTLSVFNKGLGNAYSLVVNDDNWKSDKFRIVSGANNFTLDYLNAGDQCAAHARKKKRARNRHLVPHTPSLHPPQVRPRVYRRADQEDLAPHPPGEDGFY